MINKVRITLTRNASAKRVFEETFDPSETTASLAAKEMIDYSIALRDGDELSVEFLSDSR